MALQIFGKTALVTGGGSGICLEFTKRLLEAGCNVLIADLALIPEAAGVVSSSKASETTNEGKARATFKKTDVTDWAQLQAAFDVCMKEFGSIDIVCPGAGIFEPPWSNFWHLQKTADTIPTSTYKTLEINITHPIRTAQLAIDYFLRQRQNPSSGVIILTSSVSAQRRSLAIPLYTASKAAISSFTRSLGPLEQSLGIRVVAVAPATVKTPLWTEDKLLWRGEDDKWVSIEEVVEAMIDLVEKQEHVGGTVLEVSKGKRRLVNIENDPGPDLTAEGVKLSNVEHVIGKMYQQIEKEFGQ